MEGDINKLAEVVVGVVIETVAVVELVLTTVADGESFPEFMEVLAPKKPVFEDELPPNIMPLLLAKRLPELARNEPGWELGCLRQEELLCTVEEPSRAALREPP